jgi:hypothetical protein
VKKQTEMLAGDSRSIAKKSLGYWQNKSDLLKKYKDEKRMKQNR